MTRLLQAIDAGDASAWSSLLPLVDGELRKIASARLAGMAHRGRRESMHVTDLVNETYVRLLRQRHCDWQSRRHFYAAVARAMRDLLVDNARRRCRRKRGGDWNRITFCADIAATAPDPVELLALDGALRKLEGTDGLQHEIVLLRYFGGLSIDQVAETVGVSPSTVDRQWRFARAWLRRELDGVESREARDDAR